MKNFLDDFLTVSIDAPAEAIKWLQASYIQLSLNGLSSKPNPYFPQSGNFKIYMPERALIRLLQDDAAIGAYVAPDRTNQTLITDPTDGEIFLLWTTVHFYPDNKLILAANHATYAGHPLYFETDINLVEE